MDGETVNNEISRLIDKFKTIEFVKKRYDSLSPVGLVAIGYTVYYTIFKEESFLENMQKPENLALWSAMILYPIVRYFWSFHIYKMDSKGIMLKKQEFLAWTDIKDISVYDNYEEQKNAEDPVYAFEIKLTTKDDEEEDMEASHHFVNSVLNDDSRHNNNNNNNKRE